VKFLACAAVGAMMLVCGCSHDINNKEAVRQGIIDHLNSRKAQTGLDLSLMDVQVTSVAFTKNEAIATVSFQPKNSSGGMSMNYVLQRRGNRWVVISAAGTGGNNPHTGMGPGPGGGNPHGGAMGMPTTQQLPPGHPPIEPKRTEPSK
jgi:hypothetical protein